MDFGIGFCGIATGVFGDDFSALISENQIQ